MPDVPGTMGAEAGRQVGEQRVVEQGGGLRADVFPADLRSAGGRPAAERPPAVGQGQRLRAAFLVLRPLQVEPVVG
jgi:hypothetical protein